MITFKKRQEHFGSCCFKGLEKLIGDNGNREKKLVQLRLQEEQMMQRLLNTGSDTKAREPCMRETGSEQRILCTESTEVVIL